jgi:diguanylate cyclase (GGDEF)-like protein
VRPPGVKLEGAVHAPRALELPPGQSVVSIEFAALHFTNPGQNRYAYRLDGFDKSWVQADAHHRSATYTNLAPGNYVFEVKASDDRGQWGEQPARLALTIMPAYWQTWWFRLLAVLLVAALLLGGFFARVNALKRVQRKLALLVAERTSALEESNAKLAALSNTDGLTGVTNRRGFDAALADAWALAARTGTPLALAMLDVDHFKRYNDTYGHQDGDLCLLAVARALAAQFRRTGDVVARYGGEEFALLLPVSNAENALRLAEEACAGIAALQLPHAGSPYGIVTVSIGVAAMVPQPGDAAQLLLREADAALYRSKQAGRNRASMAHNVQEAERPMPVAGTVPG